MGIALYTQGALEKGTSGILALTAKEDRTVPEPAHPLRQMHRALTDGYAVLYYQYANAGRLAEAEKNNVMDCIECGACAFACPGRLHLTQPFKTAKGTILANRRKAKPAG